MLKFYVLIEPWAVYVKEEAFFISQGGLKQKWGRRWQLIEADSIEDARTRGKALQTC